jgi:hypothetical protein
VSDEPRKRCSACRQELPHDRFYRRRAARDGLQSACRDCVAEAQRRYFATPHGREARRERARVAYRRDREAILARLAARREAVLIMFGDKPAAIELIRARRRQ